MLKKHTLMGAAIALALSAGSAFAAVSPAEAAKLGANLTPFGAEKAGNAAGTIPEWNGGITKAPAGYTTPGQHHVDPFADDKPLFTITKANLDQYKDNLTPGQIAMFNTYPNSYQMPVYQTRRSGSAPQWVYDNTIKNATTAKLLDGGNGFSDAYGGIPFPIPQNGVEALWNHIARYRGTYIVRRASEVAVQRNGSYSLVTSQQEAMFKFYNPKGTAADLNNIMFYYLSFTKSPARLAGGAVLVHETLDQVKEPRQAWGYNAGQRRVRRAPNLAYDTPIAAADGLRTADDTDMINGSPDRYDWKLVGKKEIYIPYNSYKVTSPDVKYKDLLQVGHLNPAFTRNELHRVWVVEGTLKPGAEHIYSRRTMYIDEDSWYVALMDQYDTKGELWRVKMLYLMQAYNAPGLYTSGEVQHDLNARRSVFSAFQNEEPPTEFNVSVRPGDFTPGALRKLMK